MDQKFCRSCGMSLETVSKAVASHQSAPGSVEPSVKDESRAVRRMGIMLFCGIVVLLLGAVLLGIDKKLLHSDLAGVIGLVMVIAGPILAAYAVISPLWQQSSKSATVPKPKTTVELESNTSTSPEGLPAPPPSITEQTTNILEIEAAKAPRDK